MKINTKEKYPIITGMELINKVRTEPKPKFLWKGIPEGSIGLITGAQKTGKSTFAQNLAISLSVGKVNFFGEKLDGIPRKVAYINLEESYKLYSRRLDEQISTLNSKELKFFHNNFIDTPTNFPDFLLTEENWKDLNNYLIRSKAEVIILDSLTHMVIGDIEKSRTVQKFIQTFRKYITSLGKTVIVIHHTVKGNDKPIESSNIAGSRLVLQEFEYAYGFANIPTSKGGSYCCNLFNKHIENDNTTAEIYQISSSKWFNSLGKENKYALYKESTKDYRVDTTNRDLILDYIISKHSQGSQNINASELKVQFVDDGTMSKDTLYKSLKKLTENSKIARLGNGKYKIEIEDNNISDKENIIDEEDHLQSPE
tara:strand:+ start:439 stop:1545 length:1107 start_codon:yes stop_codon:yes gene_type:complete